MLYKASEIKTDIALDLWKHHSGDLARFGQIYLTTVARANVLSLADITQGQIHQEQCVLPE